MVNEHQRHIDILLAMHRVMRDALLESLGVIDDVASEIEADDEQTAKAARACASAIRQTVDTAYAQFEKVVLSW